MLPKNQVSIMGRSCVASRGKHNSKSTDFINPTGKRHSGRPRRDRVNADVRMVDGAASFETAVDLVTGE